MSQVKMQLFQMEVTDRDVPIHLFSSYDLIPIPEFGYLPALILILIAELFLLE